MMGETTEIHKNLACCMYCYYLNAIPKIWGLQISSPVTLLIEWPTFYLRLIFSIREILVEMCNHCVTGYHGLNFIVFFFFK